MTKHFVKTLIMFSGMILIGLLGIFLINHYGNTEVNIESDTQVAN